MFSNPQKNLLQANLNEGMIVAEFGTGSGFYAIEALKRVGENGKVYAIDFNSDLLKKLKNEAKALGLDNLSVINGDVEVDKGTSLKGDEVDMVVIANTLFSLSSIEKAFIEAKRILKQKGRMLIIEWSDSFGGIGPHMDHVVTKEKATKIALEVGFSFVQEIEAGDHHYGIILRKER